MNRFQFYLTVLFFVFCSTNNTLFSKNSASKEEAKTLNAIEGKSDFSDIVKKEREAIKQSDHLALASAYHERIRYYYANNNEDSVAHYAFLADKELNSFRETSSSISEEQTKLYENLKIAFATAIIDSYLSNNKYDLALMYLKQIVEDENFGKKHTPFEAQVYYFLGVTYIHSKKGQEALESFKQGYEIHEQSPDKEPYSYYIYFRGMSHALMRLKNYDEMIAINDSVDRRLEAEQLLIGEKSYPYYIIKFSILYESASALIKKENLQAARKKLDEAKNILSNHLDDTPHKYVYFQVESQYYLASKNYKKAREYIEGEFEYDYNQEGRKGIYNYLEGNLHKAAIMRQAGETEKAYDLLYELYQLNDSLNTASFSSQVAEIQTIYKVDKMKLESERSKSELNKMRYILIGSILISVLLIYIAYTVWRNAKILKKKNRQLYHQYSELEKSNLKIKELQQKNKDYAKRTSESDNEDMYETIINKLDAYLNEHQLFKNPDITREHLALSIGTNRQYLIEAIKEKTGKTFNEYIYEYRLKYAFRAIVNEQEKKISDIYLEAGFFSNATFYRTFRAFYGMTPSELRNILK